MPVVAKPIGGAYYPQHHDASVPAFAGMTDATVFAP